MPCGITAMGWRNPSARISAASLAAHAWKQVAASSARRCMHAHISGFIRDPCAMADAASELCGDTT
jgi:hypothetical protein